MQPGVLSGGNLVYCAPTSGGKSAVAEILMLRRLITTGRTAMLVMPFVSLCDEKTAHLELLLKPLEKWGPPLFYCFLCILPSVCCFQCISVFLAACWLWLARCNTVGIQFGLVSLVTLGNGAIELISNQLDGLTDK